MVPVIWLALNRTTFFALNRIFFPANEEAILRTKQPIRFQGVKDKEYHVANFATFVSKTLIFPLKKWMNLISNRLSTASIKKNLNWPSPVFERFQNGCNKVVIEPRVEQFWSEIILMISNRTHAARLFDFEITRMISAQIALHSVQLPLFITHLSYYEKSE